MKKIIVTLFLTLSINAQERIIALSPAINEILFALDANESVIANTEYSLFPEVSKKLPKVGGYFSPSLEKIVALQPSLVIMQNNNYKLSLKLKRLGIKSKIIKIDKLESINLAILEIGNIVKKEERAKEIVHSINQKRSKLKGIVNGKKILIVFGRNKELSKQVFVAGQNLYYDEIINESNNSNALQSKRKGQPILNMENIIASNPDIVLLLARLENNNISDKELMDAWLKLPISASKTKSIYINEHAYAGIPSDRLSLFLEDFRLMLEDYHARTQ